MSKKSNTSTDKRMLWIIQFEENKKNSNAQASYYDYEISSEIKICGFLNYDNGCMCCRLLDFNKNIDGLYGYTIRIKQVNTYAEEKQFDLSQYSKNGYFHSGGIIGELISIFSVFFSARFFLISSTSIFGEFSFDKLPSRIFYSLKKYLKPNIDSNLEMFSEQDRNWIEGNKLPLFLDKIKQIDGKYHQSLINSFYWYSEAIREIGHNNELFYIKMVSCIEALLGNEKYSDRLDEKMRSVLENADFTKKETDQIESWLDHRNIKKRFCKFLIKYSKGFPIESKNNKNHIQSDEYESFFKRIYDARSGYLHEGMPMFISVDYKGEKQSKFDIDGSLGEFADRKFFDPKKQLPRPRWFERIVNYCLKKYIDEKATG